MNGYKPDHTKRVLLKGAVSGLFLCAPATAMIAGSRHPVSTDPIPDVDSLLDSMKAIGWAYLEQYPHERSRQDLQRLLDCRVGSHDQCAFDISWPHLHTRIIEDFGNDDVVFLKGWALARTEARLCALSVV